MREIDSFVLGVIVASGLTGLVGILLFANQLDIEDAGRTLSAVVTAVSFVLAAFVFYRNSNWRKEDSDIKKSEFLFEEALNGYSRATDLLSDQNNDRVKWIMAARALGEADRLSFGIVYEPHKLALDIRKIAFRNTLYENLTIEDTETGGRAALPIQFFLGAKDYSITPEDAARRSTPRVTSYAIAPYGNHPSPEIKFLAPASVHAVFDFIKFPEGYEDPLDKLRERTPGSVGDAYFLGEGAMNFLRFLEEHFVSMGMCYRRDDPDGYEKERTRINESELPE